MKKKQFAIVAACAVLCLGPWTVVADEPTLDARLERLAERLETQRQEMNIPGMAIVIVKDDEVIFVRGFGVSDIDTQAPVDEHTLFAIGSSTKAFTSALVGLHVDAGLMDWDDPIRKHLPEFRLHDQDVAEQVTLRDTLSHRTGLSRTDLLWASGEASSAEILQAIGEAELYVPFRTQWHYNNIMFLAAGEASARVAETGWHTLVQSRLLEPLGMHDSNSTYAAAQANVNLSQGYLWDDDAEVYKHHAMRNLDNIGPAGSINSTAQDMAQWLRLQLGRGELDGQRLISQAQIEAMWEPVMDIGAGMNYGLGWMVHTHRGKRLIEHGGNIDGFASMVSLLPDENIGFALLMNVAHTPLQSMCHAVVYDTLLMDEAPVDDTPMDLDQYVGKYYFAVMDADLEVLIRDGKLAVDVPGQMVYELKSPDEEGKWYFALTDTIAVQFRKDENGKVIGMDMHQAGMVFEMPREGVEPPLEVDMAIVGHLLGRYQAESLPLNVGVLIQNGRLAVDVPNQMVYELHEPDGDGRWVFRMTDTIFVTFEEDEDDKPVVVMHQGGEATRLYRVEDGGDALLSVQELLALVTKAHQAHNISDIRTIVMVDELRMVHQGITGTVTFTSSGPQRLRQDMFLGRFGFVNYGMTADQAWLHSNLTPSDPSLSMEQVEYIHTLNPLALYANWHERFETVTVMPSEHVDDRLVYVVKLEQGTTRRTIRIDAERGFVVSETTSMNAPPLGRISQDVQYDDFQAVAGHGIVLPMRTATDHPILGTMEVKRLSVKINTPVDEAVFEYPGE